MERPWLYSGAKVTPTKGDAFFNLTNPGHLETAPTVGEVYTVTCIETWRSLVIFSVAERPDDTWFDARDFRPLITDESRATIVQLKQAMRDHVAKNGAGIKRGVRV